MNRRLRCILSHIPDGVGMIDVGTDHGYLPLELLQSGYGGNVFASDINPGPLQAAKRSFRDAGLASRATFLLCDGLELCPPREIDCIVIAGMGGDSICGILDRAEWCMDPNYTLVLQPMTRAEVLRYWLIYNEFEITGEDLVEDRGTVYPVLTARFGGHTALCDAELYTGALEMIRPLELGEKLLDTETSRFERVLDGLSRSAKDEDRSREKLLREILSQLREMKARWQV